MRISQDQHEVIKKITSELVGDDVLVTLFGSRVDDKLRGGDVDLLIDVAHDVDNPAWLVSQLSAKISRFMGGRSVDVVVSAPNLMKQAIHEQARRSGVLL